MGWTVKNSGVVITPKIENYLNQLSDKLPFDIVVTSGFRTPEAQTAAMFTKIELGDDLIALYKDDAFAQSVIDAYPDPEKGAAAVRAYVARGGGKTMHLSGNAVDIRTRDKTQSEIDTIMRTVEEMGDRALYEPIPPHIDISFRKDYTPKKKPFLIVAAILGAIWLTVGT